jgi:3-hydroxyisobutyrate dehydrogenase
MKVGYVGLGTMGGALARRLLLSRSLTVFDARPDAVAALAENGATSAKDAAAVARECDVIMICVPTSSVVRRVVFDPGGLLEGLSPGKVVVDQTTGDPTETRAIAETLAQHGVTLLDAPVSGGTRGAIAGTIAIICGGPKPEFDLVRPILAEISPNIVHCGEVGAGHAAKLVQNAVAACNRVITLECVAAGCRGGLTLYQIAPAINRSSGWNGGAERIIPALRTDSPTTDFQMGLMLKDLNLAMGIGNVVGAPMLIANTVRGLFQTCVNEKGPLQNLDQIARLIEKMGNVTFVDHAGR